MDARKLYRRLGERPPARIPTAQGFMTGALRTTARNPVAIAMMGLLILVFLILGVGGGGRLPDILSGGHGDDVVVAGAHSMSSRDFQKIFDQNKQRYEQQAKQEVTVDFLVRNGFDRQLLNEIAEDEAETEMLNRAGVNPDASLIDNEIKKLPFAFDKVTGQFSEQQFIDFLARQGLTPREAEAELTDELTQRHFMFAAQNGFRIPYAFAALNAVTGLQNRDISYFTLPASSVPQPAQPTDAQLTDFMHEHAQQLMRPEMRIITVALFSAKALAPSIKVDPAEVQKEFNFKKDTLSTPERRTVIEIPVRSVAQANEASARLAKGEAPDAIAKSFGAEAVNYPDAPQSAIPDGKVAAAAFALQPGQVSGPVQGELGMAVLKVVKVTPASAANLETARPGIEADLRTRAAQNQAYELSQKFDDARQAGSSVADASRKAGVAVLTLGPVTSSGLDVDGKPVTALTPEMLKSAFAKAQGEDGDLEDAGPGEHFAVHVDRVLPPSLPPLEEKRPLLTQAYLHEQVVLALKGRADALIAQIHKGATIDQVAAQSGAHVIRQAGMQRIQAQQYKALGGEFLQGVFTAKPGDVFMAGADTGLDIIRLDAIRNGDPTAMARAAQTIAPRLSQDYFQDIMTSLKAGARQQVKVSINLARADQVLGVDPSIAKGEDGKPVSKAK
jgi:peptidyl-prolyl cis-trans isomerase D